MSSNSVISVTIVGDDTTAFFEHFSQVAERFGYVRKIGGNSAPDEADASIDASIGPATIEPPAQRRRGRRPRAAVDELPKSLPDDETIDMFIEPQAEDVKAAEPVTLEDAKEAGRSVIGRKGTQALRTILDGFNVQKVIELKDDQLLEFVEKCRAV